MDKVYDIIDHKLILSVAGKKIEIDLRQAIWPCSTFSILYLLLWRKTGFQDLSRNKILKLQSSDKVNPDDKPYIPGPVNIPPIKGWMAVLFRKLLRSPIGRLLLIDNAKSTGELDLFLRLDIPDKPTYYPILFPSEEERSENGEFDLQDYIVASDKKAAFHFNTISDYNAAYRNNTSSPLEVARKIIDAIKDCNHLRIIIEFHEDDIIKRAKESTERWKNKAPLSVFDGVPISVKDEIFLADYPCRAGTPIEELSVKKKLSEEGTMVRRLREGGAIFIGIANMHQLGVGITGINPSKYHGTCRNPYNIKYPPGGSSSGPAASVASGLCPVSLGADGGGSIRIPSAICGIVGAKASFGRISGTGLHSNCDTVGHAGALCATVRDAAITYGFLAGPDPDYEVGLVQPPHNIDQFMQVDLTGVKVGVDWSYFNDCQPEIAQLCKRGVEYLKNERNAEIVDISIPELQESMRAHVITTLTEMYTYSRKIYHHHHDEINIETENNFAIGESFKGSEYYQAQKQRTRAMNILKRLFKDVDCIVSPVFGDFMPELNADMLKYGYMNLKHTSDVIRFSVLGNLAGNPSISVPIGYASVTGLPVGLMVQTCWWKENLMFRIANSLSDCCELKRPEIYYDIIASVSERNTSTSNGIESPDLNTPMMKENNAIQYNSIQ